MARFIDCLLDHSTREPEEPWSIPPAPGAPGRNLPAIQRNPSRPGRGWILPANPGLQLIVSGVELIAGDADRIACVWFRVIRNIEKICDVAQRQVPGSQAEIGLEIMGDIQR